MLPCLIVTSRRYSSAAFSASQVPRRLSRHGYGILSNKFRRRNNILPYTASFPKSSSDGDPNLPPYRLARSSDKNAGSALCFGSSTEASPGQSIHTIGDTESRRQIVLKAPPPLCVPLLLEKLNDSQAQAVTQPLSSITRVVAGPGAGKTRVLTTRIAYLLHEDPRNQVLAVTFTRKAAGEMRERLQNILEGCRHGTEVCNDMDTSVSSGAYEHEYNDPTSSTTITGGHSIIQEEVVGHLQDLAPEMDRVTLGTFHSVCAKILRWNGGHLSSLPTVTQVMAGSGNVTNLDGSYVIIDQSEQLRVLRDLLKREGIDLKHEVEVKPLDILSWIAKLKTSQPDDQDPARKTKNRAAHIARQICSSYRQKLFSTNSLDFDDLIHFTRELLDVHLDVREKLQRKWTHILVDEFQDTSTTQLNLVQLLTTRSLFVVGDADQSIYSWRGAHVGSMTDFCDVFNHFHPDGVDTVHLMENYRSTTNIVGAAQKIISANFDKVGKPTKRSQLREDMKPMRGSGPKPRILACANGKAEANFVVDTIRGMISSEHLTQNKTVAIVYRTNAQSRAIEEACVQKNLPYVIRGAAGSFYSRIEIKDCLCYLRWLYNGRDQSSMERAFRTPTKGIGEKSVLEFIHYCAKVEEHYREVHPDLVNPSPLDILISFSNGDDRGPDVEIVADVPARVEFLTTRALKRFDEFSRQMRILLQKARYESVANVTATVIDQMGLKDHIDSISKSRTEFEDRWSNVQELRQATQKYSKSGPALGTTSRTSEEDFFVSPLGSFLDDVALVTDIGEEKGKDERCERNVKANLMTIHASKGMEFDVVFMVGCEDGTLPSNLALKGGQNSVAAEEEQRLCYVAMTRAKDTLVMTWRRETSVWGGSEFRTVDKNRSRFLDVLVSNSGRKHMKNQKAESSSSPSSVQNSKEGNKATKNRGGERKSESISFVKPRMIRNQESHRITPRIRTKLAEPSAGGRSPAVQQRRKYNSPSQMGAVRRPPVPSRAPAAHMSQRHERSKKKSSSNTREEVDSTWFYPVGSLVLHRSHGEGKVLPPPADDKMKVRVLFKTGEEVLMSAEKAELFPI